MTNTKELEVKRINSKEDLPQECYYYENGMYYDYAFDVFYVICD